MRHIIGLLILLTSFATVGAAQPPQTELDRLIDGIQKKYSQLKTLGADFSQHYRDSSGRSFHESGQVILQRPNLMRWEYTSPERKTFISDGRRLYFYLPLEKQVTISSLKEGTDPRTPFLFLLRRSNLRRDFSSITFATESPIFAGNKVLAMVPRRAPADFRRMIVEVDPVSFQIRRVSSVDAAGVHHSFTFSNVKENNPVAPGTFHFTVPPGTQVLKGDTE